MVRVSSQDGRKAWSFRADELPNPVDNYLLAPHQDAAQDLVGDPLGKAGRLVIDAAGQHEEHQRPDQACNHVVYVNVGSNRPLCSCARPNRSARRRMRGRITVSM